MGVEFDDWQDQLGYVIFGKRANGSYAITRGGAVLSIPRQSGKTFLVAMIIFAMCLRQPGLKVLWTAQRLSTSDETYMSMVSLTELPKVAPFVDKAYLGNGNQTIRFRNGSRIKVGSRDKQQGRGEPGVGVVVFDEAQHLRENTLHDMVPTMNTVKNALTFMMGTPPRPEDQGEVFKDRRAKALNGRGSNMLYVEFSADDDADLDDQSQWAKANPSFPGRTDEDAIFRLREQLDDEGFKREALGIWDQAGARRGIPADLWDACAVDEGPEDGIRSFAVTFSQDGSRQAVAAAMKTADGVHVEVVGTLTGNTEAGVKAVADWLADRRASAAMIVLCGNAGATVLADALRDRGVRNRKQVHVMTTAEYTTACAMLLESVRDGSVTHPRVEDPMEDALESSVAVCDQRKRGTSGAWGWESTTEDGDETPIEAVSCALWAAKTTNRVPGRKQEVMA
jgi:hypothetical protein